MAVLLSVDLLGLLGARAFLLWSITHSTQLPEFLAGARFAGPLADPGRPASLVFWIAILFSLFGTGAYTRHRELNAPVRLGAASLLAGAVAAMPLAAVIGLQHAVSEMLLVAAVTALVLVPGRRVAEWLLHHAWPRDLGAAPAILVGPAESVHSRIAMAITAGGGDYRLSSHWVVGLDPLPDPASFAHALGQSIDRDKAQAVVLAEPVSTPHLHALVEEALSAGCRVLCPPRAVDIGILRPRVVWHRDQALLEFCTPVLHLSALVTKRMVDILGAAALLVVVSPLMLFIAIGVKLDSPGPAFFRQDRAGLGGRRFRMLKFRTMRTGADHEKQDLAHLNHSGDARLFKIPFDPRVTRFGILLRRWSLDELPQFWNVLRGDMSLVGPRPFFESDFAQYEDHHFRRLDTKPGITGLWQVGGRSDVVNFEDVVFLDRQYIENWSVWLDLSILLRTLPSVIRRTGAY